MPAPWDEYVLVVDDDPDTRGSLALLFDTCDIPAVTAADGAEALAVTRAGRPPAVILLDLAMPVMTGEAFLAEHEADPLLSTVPVVVLSAYAARDRMATIPPVCGYFLKPADPAALLAAVRRLLPS